MLVLTLKKPSCLNVLQQEAENISEPDSSTREEYLKLKRLVKLSRPNY